MQWHDLNEFLTMGGYAVYVWPSLGICMLGMLVELIMLEQRQRRIQHIRQQESA